jgi:hypothetical protein
MPRNPTKAKKLTPAEWTKLTSGPEAQDVLRRVFLTAGQEFLRQLGREPTEAEVDEFWSGKAHKRRMAELMEAVLHDELHRGVDEMIATGELVGEGLHEACHQYVDDMIAKGDVDSVLLPKGQKGHPR